MAKLSLKQLKDLQEDEELDLSAMQLAEVPAALPMVSKLSSVDLSQNSIAALPNSVCKMSRLIRLDLAKNKIHHLPNDIGNLTNLQYLNLGDNDIDQLPLSFAELKSLKWLDLRGNPLEEKLAKAAGNCGNDKECRAAAQNVLHFMAERKKFVEYQKEKENKVNEKIKLRNNEEKRKVAQLNGNAKSNGPKETSSKVTKNANGATSATTATTTAKKSATRTRAATNDHNEVKRPAKIGCFRKMIRFPFIIAYYVILFTFLLSTVAILNNCHQGGGLIPGSRPLCKDLTSLTRFEQPSPKFLTNIANTYSTVHSSYSKSIRSYSAPYVNEAQKKWKEFSRTEIGREVAQYVYKFHAFVVKQYTIAQRFVTSKVNELRTWYKNGGDKKIAEIVDPIKTVLLIIVEVLKDALTSFYGAARYAGQRAYKFGSTWYFDGYARAIDTLNH